LKNDLKNFKVYNMYINKKCYTNLSKFEYRIKMNIKLII